MKNGEAGKKPTELVRRLAELCRKVWNPSLFKAQVSPHEFLQEVALASEGRFKITKQGDPIEFLGWLLNRLHRDLGGSKKKNSSEPSCVPFPS
jgi:U4/U6.U5 tri-snRNP-associated protein 2